MVRPTCFIPVASLLALSLGGCASPPHIAPGPAMMGPETPAAARSLTAPPGDWPQDTWWQRYRDPQLDQLISEALEHSPSLEIAAARVRKADAITDVTHAADLPQVALGGSFAESKLSYWNGAPYAAVPKGINNAASARVGLDWTLDFFGRNRAAIAASISTAQAMRADTAQARLILTTGVVSGYALLLGQIRDDDLAQDTLRVRSATADLVRQRRAQGLETLASEGQAVSALESARQALESSHETVDLARLQLATLLGEGPDRALSITRPVDPQLGDFGLPANLPADLLGRRPDIRAARMRVEARAAQIKVARAGFYPSINLSAFAGPQSLGLYKFLDVASIAGSAGPAISLPLFRGGALSANLRGSHADYDEAVASYNEALLHALSDVAQVSTSQKALRPELAHARAARDAADVAYQAAIKRYRGGLLTYIAVLSAENTLISAKHTVSTLETRRFTLDVALVRALGGGA